MTGIFNSRINMAPMACVVTLMGSISCFSAYAESTTKIQSSDFAYKGAFRMPLGTYGESTIAWANGTFAVGPNSDSIFVVGHTHHQAIAEFRMPQLVQSTNLNDLKTAAAPTQVFSRVISRAPTGNPDTIDQITGLKFFNNKLIVNGVQYYDGDANNTDTTLVIDEPSNLAGSAVHGFHKLSCGAFCAGWITEIPSDWQQALGGTYLAGFAANFSIITRFSQGPSAYTFKPEDILSRASSQLASVSSNPVATSIRMMFPIDHALSSNQFAANNLWTELSAVIYGFIVPGTSTYVTIGSSGGHVSGIGYKLTNGAPCGGYCANDPKDYYNYMWLWDLNDLVKVKDGQLASYAVRPYWYGKFNAPFQNGKYGYSLVLGADYDRNKNVLYLLLGDADRIQSEYDSAPVVVAYEIAQNLSRPNPPSDAKATAL